MCDDVFDEEDVSDFPVPEENEWRRMEEARTAEGFREGIERGENVKLQEGFNAGFCSTTTHAFRAAKLRGAITALLGINATNSQSPLPLSVNEQLQALLQTTVALERRIVSDREHTELPANTQKNSQQIPASQECGEHDSCGKSESCCRKYKRDSGTVGGSDAANTGTKTDWFDNALGPLLKEYQEILLVSGTVSRDIAIKMTD